MPLVLGRFTLSVSLKLLLAELFLVFVAEDGTGDLLGVPVDLEVSACLTRSDVQRGTGGGLACSLKGSFSGVPLVVPAAPGSATTGSATVPDPGPVAATHQPTLPCASGPLLERAGQRRKDSLTLLWFGRSWDIWVLYICDAGLDARFVGRSGFGYVDGVAEVCHGVWSRL